MSVPVNPLICGPHPSCVAANPDNSISTVDFKDEEEDDDD
jgi:hypothetical protein